MLFYHFAYSYLLVHNSLGKLKRGATNLVLPFLFPDVRIACLLFTTSTGLMNYSTGVSIMVLASTIRTLIPRVFVHC